MLKIKLFHQYFSLDISNLGITQSHHLRAFGIITQEPECSQILDLCTHKANNNELSFNTKHRKEQWQSLGWLLANVTHIALIRAKINFREKLGSVFFKILQLSTIMQRKEKIMTGKQGKLGPDR